MIFQRFKYDNCEHLAIYTSCIYFLWCFIHLKYFDFFPCTSSISFYPGTFFSSPNSRLSRLRFLYKTRFDCFAQGNLDILIFSENISMEIKSKVAFNAVVLLLWPKMGIKVSWVKYKNVQNVNAINNSNRRKNCEIGAFMF